MKLLTVCRTLRDRMTIRTWREQVWDLQKICGRIARTASHSNRHFAAVVVKDQARFLTGTARPVRGETRERADAAARWLLRAQDATGDGGVSLGYFPCDTRERGGWRRSYPETTGYIIASLLEFAKRRGREDVRERCFRMAKWETEVQMPSGAVQGGEVCPAERQTPAVFNTGMVLQGYTAALRHGAGETILSAAKRAADFLVGDQGSDGHFRTHGAFVTPGRLKTYNCLCGWALVRFAEDTGDEKYQEAGMRAAEAAVQQQNGNGWFADNCLNRPEAPLLHTIGYTLQGILEVGILTRREDLVNAVRRGINPILERMGKNGFLHARYYEDWEPASFSSCLTGNAQIAVVCYRLSETTGEVRYAHAANLIVDHLKALQVLDSRDEALNGALAGSFPIFGDYMTAGYPNWATKYFLDSLMLQEQFPSSE